MVIFQPLGAEHMPVILDRLGERLNEWLAARGVSLDLLPRAREFLLERGTRDPRQGARTRGSSPSRSPIWS